MVDVAAPFAGTGGGLTLLDARAVCSFGSAGAGLLVDVSFAGALAEA